VQHTSTAVLGDVTFERKLGALGAISRTLHGVADLRVVLFLESSEPLLEHLDTARVFIGAGAIVVLEPHLLFTGLSLQGAPFDTQGGSQNQPPKQPSPQIRESSIGRRVSANVSRNLRSRFCGRDSNQ